MNPTKNWGVNNEANINHKIRVCIDRSSSELLTTDDSPGVFVGVVRRKRTSSFYIENIDEKVLNKVSFTILNPKMIKVSYNCF